MPVTTTTIATEVLGEVEVAGEAEPDLVVGRIAHLVEQAGTRDDEPGDTESALHSELVDERLLDGVGYIRPGSDPLNGDDFCAFGLRRVYETAHHAAAVELHSAGTALTFSAPFFGAGEAGLIAQPVEQVCRRGAGCREPLAVEGHGDFGGVVDRRHVLGGRSVI